MLISSLFLDTLLCWNRKFLLGDKGCSSLNPQLCNFITVKVHLTPKYFFRSNKSLHLFETHCAFLPRFNPNLDFFQAVKVTKSGHYLLITEQVRGMGLFLGGRHRLICIELRLCKNACKEVCDVNPGIDPYPLLARSCDR